MAAHKDLLPMHFARWLLGLALRYWPKETREWGIALAAEMEETTGTLEPLLWSLGGISLFARAVLSRAWRWLKLPVGTAVPVRNGGSAPVDSRTLPKRSRLFTLALLTAAAVVLFLPEGREAVTTVGSTWSRFDPSPLERLQLALLAHRAKKENDATALAFLAFSADRPQKFITLADKAVSLDPSLVWIYAAAPTRFYVASTLDSTGPQYDLILQDRLEHLQESDPENAMPGLVAADLLANSRISRLYAHHSPSREEIKAVLADDPRWKALMNQAFAAPRYDSYVERHRQLVSAVWNRESNLSPWVVGRSLLGHPLPDLTYLKIFAEAKFQAAQRASAARDFGHAEDLLREVVSFGERMVSGGSTDFERRVGLTIERDATHELAEFYSQAGRAADARSISAGMKQLDKRVDQLLQKRRGWDPKRSRSFQRMAILVHGFGVLAILAGLAAILGILLTELWPTAPFPATKPWRRKILCLVVDYGPGVLFAASTAFLLSFLPFSRALAQFRSSSDRFSGDPLVTEAMLGLNTIPRDVLGPNYGVLVWSLVTGALGSLALFIVVRSIYRHRPIQPITRDLI